MIAITKILSEEHQNILKVAELLEKECDAVERGGKLRKEFFEQTIRFIREYADMFHHGKEEDILFVELCKESTNMHCNPTQQMLYEHDLGRGFVKEMEAGLKAGDKSKVVSGARSYAKLIQEHIYKEDHILYPMAEEALGEKEKKELESQFRKADEKNKKLSDNGLKIMGELR